MRTVSYQVLTVQQNTVQMRECLAVNCFKFVFVKHLQAYNVITAGVLAVPTIQIVVEQCSWSNCLKANSAVIYFQRDTLPEHFLYCSSFVLFYTSTLNKQYK